MAQRIEPGGRREIGLPTWAFSRIAGLVSGTEPMKLFTTMGRHRGLFRAWLWFGGRLMPFGKLPRRETELVILRVAHLRRCEYEREHHVRMGRRVGLDDADFARVEAGPDAAGWSPREQAVLTAVDEIHETGDVGDATWTELSAHLNPKELIELVMLAAHYEMLATFIGTLRIEPDRRR